MKKSLQNKLKAYTALSAVAAFGANDASAQISSTTVNYTGGYETYDIDIDGNGTVDYQINGFKSVTNSYSTSWTSSWGTGGSYGNFSYSTYIRGVEVIPQTFMIGSNTYTNNIMSYGNGAYPASTSTYAVGITKAFNNTPSPLAVREVYTSDSFRKSSWSSGAGSWSTSNSSYYVSSSSGYFAGSVDQYVGVQFVIDELPHHGWIRISVSDKGETWTVKETGYEMQPIVTAFPQSQYPELYVATGVSDTGNSIEAEDLTIRATKLDHDFSGQVRYYAFSVVNDDVKDFGVVDALNNQQLIIGNGGGDDNAASFGVDTDGALIEAGVTYRIYTTTMSWNNEPLRVTGDITVTLSNTVGIDESTISGFSAYVSNGSVNVNSSIEGGVVKVYDINGKIVSEKSMNGNNLSFELNNSQGIYVVSLENSKGRFTQKIKF